MLLLAIDCTFGGHAAALVRDGSTLASAHRPQTHASDGLMSTLTRLLDRAAVEVSDLDGIAFAAGPGLFSGIRAACACAQGIAYAANLQVAAICSMRAAAATCGASHALIAYPAQRDHCYLASYTGAGIRQIRAPALYPLDCLPRLAGTWQLCGRNLAPIQAALQRRGGSALHIESRTSLCTCLAPAVARIAQRRWRQASAPQQARPTYVRNKVAYTKAELAAAGKRA